MNNNDQENGNRPDSESINLKLDPSDRSETKSLNLNEEKTPMEETVHKTARLAKINLVLTLLGLGGLGYLHFSDKASLDETIAKNKATMKQEIVTNLKEGLASSEQLNNLLEKNAELEVKLDGYAAQITNLETKSEQLQAELQKTAALRTKISELEASVKKNKAPAKIVAKASATKNAKASAPRKGAPKGRKK